MANNFSIYLVVLAALILALALFLNYVPTQTTQSPEKALTGFLTSNLRSVYTDSFTTGNVSYPIVIHPVPTKYIASWNAHNTNFSSYLVTNSNNTNVKFIRVVINPPSYFKGLNLTIVPLYLNVNGTIAWKCWNVTQFASRVCENFSETAAGKHGQAVVIEPNQTTVVFCDIPKGSEIYGKNTCLF